MNESVEEYALDHFIRGIKRGVGAIYVDDDENIDNLIIAPPDDKTTKGKHIE